MTERCPKCAAGVLSPFEQVAVRRCGTCSGFWASPEALGDAHAAQLLQLHDLQPERRLEQDLRTGACPDGHGLLRRARVTNDDPYFLERCARCGGVWFDPGDWSRLLAAGLLDDVTKLWSPAWRDHLAEEHNRASLEADLRQKLGQETFEALDDLATKLQQQNLAALALAYLRERLRER